MLSVARRASRFRLSRMMEHIGLPPRLGPRIFVGADPADGGRSTDGPEAIAPVQHRPGDALVVHHVQDSDEEGGAAVAMGALPMDVGENAPEDQVVLAPKRPHFAQHSAEAAAYARAHKKAKAAEKKAALAIAKHEESSTTLHSVGVMVPGAAKLLGKTHTEAIGKKTKSLVPSHLLLAVRALHLPLRSGINMGIKFRRLVAAGADLVLRRQSSTLTACLESSRERLDPMHPGHCLVHVCDTHLWDEVELKFRHTVDGRRAEKKATTQGTMVQRGSVAITLFDPVTSSTMTSAEPWLCKPLLVTGAAAADLLPAILSASPVQFRFDLGAMMTTMQAVGSFTWQPMCDKASSNLSILKLWGHALETVIEPALGKKAPLYWPDTCGIHLHHRAKLQLRELRRHTMRHFSIANLYRLASVQRSMMESLEQLVARRVRRVVAPPPDGIRLSLRTVLDVLAAWDAPHHQRKGRQGRSQRLEDLDFLASMVNGDLLEDVWTHWCWDQGSGGACCASAQEAVEKSTRACANAFFAGGDPIPAESRWTHLLSNIKRTLLRSVVFGVGLACFPAEGAAAAHQHTQQQPDIDGEATDNFFEIVNRTRRQKVAEYYADPTNIHHLCVFAIITDISDSLLMYPLMGDIGRAGDGPSKMDLLLRKTKSLVGQACQSFHDLLGSWAVGGHDRKPWCLLDATRADTANEAFMRWARCQILRLSSALFRRYEARLSCWPYRLYTLIDPEEDATNKLQVCQALLTADRGELDTYSRGLRKKFTTIDGLLAEDCLHILRTDFAAHAYGTDMVERLNAELSRGHPSRGPARNFVHTARESVLRQLVVAHRQRGGHDPLGPRALVDHPKEEFFVSSPLLGSAALDVDKHAVVAPALPGHAGTSPAAGESDGGVALVVAPHVAAPHIQNRRELRQNPGNLLATRAGPSSSSAEMPRQRRGLNPFMLELNEYLKAAKHTKGATLTTDEVAKHREDFRKRWENTADKKVYHSAYQAWRDVPASPKPAAATPEYNAIWGGGCVSSPVTKEELFQYVSEHAWPSDAVVAGGEAHQGMAADGTSAPDFAASSNFNLWGVGRWARNVARSPSDAHQRECIEKGFFSFLDHLGRAAVEAGDIMVIADGPSLNHPAQHDRLVALITGITHSPKVFDVTMLRFKRDEDKHAPILDLPCEVIIGTRACRVSDHFQSVDINTSCELIDRMVRSMSSVRLWHPKYTVIAEDGSLNLSKISALSEVGVLWELGQKKPFRFGGATQRSGGGGRAHAAAVAARIAATLRTGDPFDENALGNLAQTNASTRGGGAGEGAAGRAPTHAVAGVNLWKSSERQHSPLHTQSAHIVLARQAATTCMPERRLQRVLG